MASKSLRETSRILKAKGYEISHEGLRRAVQSGRITLEPDGGLDPAKVMKMLKANTHPGRGKGGNGGAPPDANGTALGPSYQQVRTFREGFAAKIRELEYRQMTGELIEVSEVRRVAFARARKARDLLLSIPARVGPVVAGMTDAKACVQAIEDEIRHALDELADPGRDPW
jgi:hypothetical protein